MQVTLGKKFVLLLEDNPDDAFFLKRAWRARGNPEEIVCVENGLEAQRLIVESFATETRFSLIITDLKMPGCDGFEFLQWARNQTRLQKIHCLVLTSSAEPRDIQRADDLGASGFFSKPSDAKAFSAVLEQIESHLTLDEKTAEIAQRRGLMTFDSQAPRKKSL